MKRVIVELPDEDIKTLDGFELKNGIRKSAKYGTLLSSALSYWMKNGKVEVAAKT